MLFNLLHCAMFTEQPRGMGGASREVTAGGSEVALSALRHYIGFSLLSLKGQSSGCIVCLCICLLWDNKLCRTNMFSGEFAQQGLVQVCCSDTIVTYIMQQPTAV